LTAMKYGVYTLLAVVVGVMLVGMLPGQLSNLASPLVETSSLQSSKEAAGNGTLSGSNITRGFGSTNGTFTDTTSTSAPVSGSITGIKTNASQSGAETSSLAYNPLADVMYYGMMGIGFFIALTVYFTAKKML
jgi:hypothetical protein